MQTLFLISILCFLALAWAGIAIARHIRASHKAIKAQPESLGFEQHLFTATEEIAKTGSPVQATHSRRRFPSSHHDISDRSDRISSNLISSNKDFGDLSDPYSRPIRANSRDRATSPKRF
jgi:hypothetical protein